MSLPLQHLRALPSPVLHDLAAALRVGRILAPASRFAVQHAVPTIGSAAADELVGLLKGGLGAGHASLLLDCVLAERGAGQGTDKLELVTTEPDVAGQARDTAVVVRELFMSANHRVSVVGFAVHQGPKVFAALADRMNAVPALAVRLCLDIARRPGDTSTEVGVLARFAQQFAGKEWPGSRLPEVYYDPRALNAADRTRASLHAKCIVVDGAATLVGSANFTEAAHFRNIEVGLLARSIVVASAVDFHIDALIRGGHLRRLIFP